VSGKVEAIGRFRVIRTPARGGMRVVYEGEDPELGRRVALKLMPLEARADAKRTARFLREARAAATVTHPNVVVVYEVGQHPAHGPYLAMEYVGGHFPPPGGGKPLLVGYPGDFPLRRRARSPDARPGALGQQPSTEREERLSTSRSARRDEG